MKPSVSVVIATWQRTALVQRCLEALAKQTMPETFYEIIIVTDGPDPATVRFMKQWLRAYRGKVAVTCISLPVKKGPAAARNAGWRKALGELIVFTDDDCVPQPECLEKYWVAYTPYRDTAIAFSGRIIVPLSGIPTDYEKNTAQLERARFVTANCACSRKSLELTGGLDEEFTMAWREDTALEFDLSEKNIPIIKVPEAVIVHPVRAASWGISIKEQKKSMFNALLYKKHTRLYEKSRMERPPRYYYIITCLLLLALVFAFHNRPGTIFCMAVWMMFTGWFAWKRLKDTSRSLPHVAEMIFTSAVIPVISVYWNLYGAVKFKTFFV
ncbi:glycosyltransferase family 2 protein [Longitalea luteola]|uniref:glycosyltransferase family 2 protein n=1 Tax=Longitalea luteola TaxID=2812563 RepID=UPI001A969587|nr:glycosyltransferase [Longitalea luteola]